MQRDGVDIIVVNRQTPDDLLRCLTSINEHPPARDFTVTVVQVQPADIDMTVAIPFMSLEHWHEQIWEENVGYNIACNHAGAHGALSTIVFMNADTWVHPDTFDGLVEGFSRYPDCGVSGPLQRDGQGSVTAGGIFGTDAAPRHRAWKRVVLGPNDAPELFKNEPCLFVAGSILAMQRAVFDELTACSLYQDLVPGANGPWAEMAHFYGDTWVSVHARAHGRSTFFLGAVQAGHQWHTSSAIGGYGEQHHDDDHEMFRKLCDHHGLDHN
jgi:cellulose synthase/poly-beta-1,6-N-acetylglucosamine synthase-like glycosyltransferase